MGLILLGVGGITLRGGLILLGIGGITLRGGAHTVGWDCTQASCKVEIMILKNNR